MSDDVPDCVTCGACCAYSREWPALVGLRDGKGIPPHMIEDGRMRCEGDRCVALDGEIGARVACTVYADRPLVCSEFAAGGEDCRMVRRHFGLEIA